MKESVKQILEMPSTMSCKEVAAALGVTYNAVISARRRHGIEYKKQNRSARKHLPELYRLLDTKKSYAEIAEVVGMTAAGVYYHANKIGISRLKSYNKIEIKKQIADDYAKGIPLKVISARYDCDRTVPCKIAKEFGVKLRNQGGSPRHAKINQLLSHGVQPVEISRMLNCALQTVYNARKKSANQS